MITIDLWTWPLDVEAHECGRLAGFLSEDERERARRFRFDRDRDRYVVARGTLREILAERVAEPPAALRFAYGGHGKPALDRPLPSPHFNLSHSRDRAALALCDGAALGLDIEAIRPFGEGVAERFFAPGEVAALRALPEHEQVPAFFRCWTRKEAVLKALGDGLARPLAGFEVSLADEERPPLVSMRGEPGAARDWALVHFVPADGFLGAIALRAKGAKLDLRLHPA
jgi:4'-phosphopantetheinyl transferase